MYFLKQSTAITVKAGPFLDETDGKTAETGLTISQADVRLSKNGGAFAQKTEATAATHDENGWYGVPLDATDTGTLGRLTLAIHESGALPVWMEFMVVPANVWDSLFSTDRLQVDTRELGDANLALTTQMKADVNTEADTALADYDPPTRAEATADKDAVIAEVDANEAKIDTVDTVVDAIKAKTDNLPADPADDSDIDAQLATIAGYLDTEVAAILTDTNELQTDLVDGGRLDLLIDAIKAKTDNLPADPADDSDIDAQLATIAGYLDTEIAAILAAVDTEVAAILADTGTDGVVLSEATRQAIADEILKRSMSNVEAIAGDHTLAAVVLAILESVLSGTTWTIKKTDGVSTFLTKTVTKDAAAEPIIGVT